MGNSFVTDRTGEILRVSPSIAAKWLERNTENRPLSRVWIADLAGAMERGEWMENGESIKFSAEGRLLDGQHRLHAVIKSGKTIHCRVEYGLPTETFITLDRGKKRNLGDALGMQGVVEHALVAAAVTWVFKIQNDAYTSSRSLTPMQLLEFYENECQGIEASIPPTRHAQKIARGSIVVALHFMFARHNRRLADDFMGLLGDGANMEKGHPVLVLRERLFADKLAKASLPSTEIIALFINAWNAFATNRTLRVLKGTYADAGMPKIVGPTWTGEAAS